MKLNLPAFVKYLKRANFVLAMFLLILSGVVLVNFGPQIAEAFVTDPQGTTKILPVKEGGTFPVTFSQTSETLSDHGVYTVTYKFSEDRYRELNSPKAVSFDLTSAMYRCPEGNGQGELGICGTESTASHDVSTISLNAGNDYTQFETYSIQQFGAVKCGSFQSDVSVPSVLSGQADGFLGGALTRTGKDLGPNCNVTASPSPSISPSPSPSASPSASPLQCGAGKIAKVVDSVMVCVAQNQEQNQAQTQNNNQNQNVNQNVVATGGSSSSSSLSSSNVNVTVNNTNKEKEIVREVVRLANAPAAASTTAVTTPQVVMQAKGDVKELPKTGLPLAALALGGLLPAGFGFKRFSKKAKIEASASSIWNERQLNG